MTTQPNPGAQFAGPLNGTELMDILGGVVWGTDTTAAVADTRTVDEAKTAAGTNRGTAYSLTKQITHFTTVGSGTGAVLPAATKPGMIRIIFNDGVSPLTVYAAGSDTIDTVPGATGVTLTNALRCQYVCTAVGKWISAQLGVISA